jgi:hypothetical protein
MKGLMMFDHIDSYRGTAVTPEMIVKSIGDCTVAGWIWYCDVHDSHGNADSEEEAKHMAMAHEEFWILQEVDVECVEDGSPCDLMVAPGRELDDV